MNKIKPEILFILFTLFSCQSGNVKNNKPNDLSSPPNNHINFISIGNSHYLNDDDKKVMSFRNVKGANTSAEYFSTLFSCYGNGVLLKSNKNNLLSKELLSHALDSLIDEVVKDSLSLTFIYYCGHGFSDRKGNLYLVPGDHNFNESSASLASLFSIVDLQEKIIEATRKYYKNDPMPIQDQAVKSAETQFNQGQKEFIYSKGTIDPNKALQEYSLVIEKYYLRFQRPRFVILADCCTEDLNVLNYNLLINKAAVDTFANVKKKIDQLPSWVKKYMNNTFTEIEYYYSTRRTKSEMWVRGNRTIYTAKLGELAPIVTSPINSADKIGPICRRLTLFFQNSKDSFCLAQLLTQLADEKFDTTITPKFENGNSKLLKFNRPSGKSPLSTTPIGTNKIDLNENINLKKRDSIMFNCNK